ncbi:MULTISPECIES: tetraspanin family protein [unclassified Microbacterium]|uniref:tetraspanin family protein n=1 Tax=unclassified Microbacterium TaxID=2609290 RepID=UPI00203C9DA9|nr:MULTISPECIES: tetraspanin family protein [unclassified Microbacterium]
MPENSSKKPARAASKPAPASTSAAASTDAPADPPAGWTPTPEAKAKATRFRWIAVVLWVVAIAAEAFGIFWLLRQRQVTGGDGELVRNPDTGLLEQQGATATFPQWAFITLIVLFVVIAALSITGSFLWKKANRLDPARRSDTVRFFVQNQLGAIIAIIAFVPLIILVFLNKDMDKGQKTIAGIVGIALAALAVVLGIDFNPPSVEQYTADQSTVIQLLGKDQVVWVDGGTVYHVCEEVSAIQTGSDKRTGTTAQAVEAGKTRLTLEFASELRKCGLPVPENAPAIADALRAIRDGKTDTTLPAPVWGAGVEAPLTVPDASSSGSTPAPTSTP